MKNRNYLQITGNWYTGSDGMSFLLVKKKQIQDKTKAKKENLGVDRYDVVGYYATLGALAAGLYRYLSMEEMMNCNAKNLEEYIKSLDQRISRIKELDAAFVDKIKKQIQTANGDS